MNAMRMTLSRAALGALLLANGCGYLRAANAAPAPMEGQLTTTLQEAERAVAESRYGVADRLLADYAETHPSTPEAVETNLWRALFKLDPANQTASPRDAIMLLDVYLGGSTAVAHAATATALRRSAVALNRAATLAAAPPAAAAPASPATAPAVRSDPRPDRADDKSNDEEIKRLKEELAKANAELERIKKRLSQPNP